MSLDNALKCGFSLLLIAIILYVDGNGGRRPTLLEMPGAVFLKRRRFWIARFVFCYRGLRQIGHNRRDALSLARYMADCRP
jgi:hypothetical protein